MCFLESKVNLENLWEALIFVIANYDIGGRGLVWTEHNVIQFIESAIVFFLSTESITASVLARLFKSQKHNFQNLLYALNRTYKQPSTITVGKRPFLSDVCEEDKCLIIYYF